MKLKPIVINRGSTLTTAVHRRMSNRRRQYTTEVALTYDGDYVVATAYNFEDRETVTKHVPYGDVGVFFEKGE